MPDTQYDRVKIEAIDRLYHDGRIVGQGQVIWVSKLDASKLCSQGRAKRFNPPVNNPKPNGYIKREDRKKDGDA